MDCKVLISKASLAEGEEFADNPTVLDLLFFALQIVVYPDTDNSMTAEGRVFIDDYNSFSYRTSDNFVYDLVTLSAGESSKLLELKFSAIEVAARVGSEFSFRRSRGVGNPDTLPGVNLNGEQSVCACLQLSNLIFTQFAVCAQSNRSSSLALMKRPNRLL